MMDPKFNSATSDDISGEDLASGAASLEPDQLISANRSIIVRGVS